MSTQTHSTTALAQHLEALHTALIVASEQADRLDDPNLSWDVGLALLSARNSVAMALGHLSHPASEPRTVVRSAKLDAIYAIADELFEVA